MIITKLCPYELQDKIELLREEMITTGLSEGLNSDQTIMISEKLDNYIALYISMKDHNI